MLDVFLVAVIKTTASSCFQLFSFELLIKIYEPMSLKLWDTTSSDSQTELHLLVDCNEFGGFFVKKTNFTSLDRDFETYLEAEH